MNRLIPLLLLAAAILAFASVFLIILPAGDIRTVAAPKGLKPYSEAELRGRAQYVGLGCVYCHSQQPRAKVLSRERARVPPQVPCGRRGRSRR